MLQDDAAVTAWRDRLEEMQGSEAGTAWLEEMQEDNPDDWEGWQRREGIQLAISQLEYLEGYPAYLEKIQSEAKRISSSKIFAEEPAFRRRTRGKPRRISPDLRMWRWN